MSFSAPSVSTPSPLTALNRPTRQRRQSPALQTSLRNSPLPSHRINPSDNIDDSDDEGGKAPQLSALARMLLDDFPESSDAASARETLADAPPLLPEPAASNGGHSPRDRMDWSHSPVADGYKTGQLGSSRMSPDFSTARELVTPAPGRYSRKVFNGTYSAVSSSGSSSNSSEPKQNVENRVYGTAYGSVVRPSATGSTVINTQASASASAIRWKRAGRGLLGGLAGPPRRGPRRDSERGDEEYHDGYIGEGVEGRSSPSSTEKGELGSDANSGSRGYSTNTSEDVDMEPPMLMSRRSRRSSPVSSAEQARINVYRGSNTPEESSTGGRSSPAESQKRSGSSSSNSMSRAAAIAAAAAALPQSVVVNDKENMLPPPTFRRPTINNSYKRLGSSEEKPAPAPVSPVKYQMKSLVPSPAKVSPPPKNNVLSTRSSNTPLRPAPPPPKMSMLEAVTASAGASATASQQSSRRQRSVVHVNGKPYRRLDAIGKGGSSKVYKVMAENFKMLAMKKVTFSSQDGEAAIRGYKGEIDLLRKLSGVDRVIRLYDWEVNDEKQCLTMVHPPSLPPPSGNRALIYIIVNGMRRNRPRKGPHPPTRARGLPHGCILHPLLLARNAPVRPSRTRFEHHPLRPKTGKLPPRARPTQTHRLRDRQCNPG